MEIAVQFTFGVPPPVFTGHTTEEVFPLAEGPLLMLPCVKLSVL